MMRTHAAGTFSMNLSWHGTPVIGYKGYRGSWRFSWSKKNNDKIN